VMLLEVPRAVDCVFSRRLNRFVAEVTVAGERVLAHVTNTGRLHDILVRGRKCVLAPLRGRKLSFRLIAVETEPGRYAVIDTRTQAAAFEAALASNSLCFLKDCVVKAREPRIPGGRADYLLDCGGREVVVELKSAVLRGPRGEAMYPDCPSDRGVRHINELARLASQGSTAAIVFVAALPGARCFRPYPEGDPRIPEALRRAAEAGVGVYSFSLYYDPATRAVKLEEPCLPVCL